jgi:cephalosporin hydroxylase
MKPQVFVELGTCGGGAARNVAMVNPDVLVISIDVNKLPQVSLIERDCKNFRFVCGDSVGLAETIGKENTGKIGVMFIDTIHEYQHTMNEFNAWRPYLADGAVVCFDDLNRQGMDRVWRELPGIKTGFSDLSAMHISGSPTDGGFGALII